jgi:hypothetical protein
LPLPVVITLAGYYVHLDITVGAEARKTPEALRLGLMSLMLMRASAQEPGTHIIAPAAA